MTGLYEKDAADALTKSERTEPWRIEADNLKARLVMQHCGSARSLVDIGCGWGQVLLRLTGHIPSLAGVDESPARLAGLQERGEGIRTYQCKSSALQFPDRSFEAALTSHFIHELELFGGPDEPAVTLREIHRILARGGRYLIMDHRDPGEGTVAVRLDHRNLDLFRYFAEHFKCRKVAYELDGDIVRLSMRDCHDFVTKIWALGTGAETLEMRETHTAVQRAKLENDLALAGFIPLKWITFNPITRLMEYYEIDQVLGEPWDRQFLLVAERR